MGTSVHSCSQLGVCPKTLLHIPLRSLALSARQCIAKTHYTCLSRRDNYLPSNVRGLVYGRGLVTARRGHIFTIFINVSVPYLASCVNGRVGLRCKTACWCSFLVRKNSTFFFESSEKNEIAGSFLVIYTRFSADGQLGLQQGLGFPVDS